MILLRVFTQTALFALVQMLSNKFRSVLTMLGIIIGVWAIVTVIAAVSGLNGFVLNEFEKFGATKMWIWGQRPDSLRDKLTWSQVKISPTEAELLREHATTLERVTMLADERVTVRYKDVRKAGVRVTGIEPDWHEIEQRFVTAGRPFTRMDDEAQLQVCLVNDMGIDEFHLENGGVGEILLLNDRRFLIVGIVETKEMSGMFGGDDSRTEVFLPFSSMYKLDDWLWTQMMAQMTSPDVAEEAEAEIRFILRRYRNFDPEWEDTFGMWQMTEAVKNFRAMATGLTAGASVLVGISLLVGGIGIMNIMLVSVSERTREIGLRKALGANPLIILFQFLIEAVVLCVIGGAIGLILGQLSTLGLQHAPIPGLTMKHAEIPVWAIALAFGFSAVVGIVFGMGPAIKAARLDPIEALRHE
jgi:putative ABC transport system permease protein